MKWIIFAVLLVILSVTKGQDLTCLSCETSDITCSNTSVVSCVDLVCMTAEVTISGETRYKKGCIQQDLCASVANLCPRMAGDSKCLGGGCCNTTNCEPVITYLTVPTTDPPTTDPGAPESSTKLPVAPTTTSEAIKPTSSKVEVESKMTPAASKSTPMSTQNVTYSKALTQEILLSSPKPTCAGIRYAINPLVIMIVVLISLF